MIVFQVYLSLPAGVSMAEGHCLICPLQHHCCATGLDEDVWSEIQVIKAENLNTSRQNDIFDDHASYSKTQSLNVTFGHLFLSSAVPAYPGEHV